MSFTLLLVMLAFGKQARAEQTAGGFFIEEVQPAEPVTLKVVTQEQSDDGESVVPSPSPSPTPSHDTPEGYIKHKFGKHADKAFELLQGEGCAENRQLDQSAVNDNRTWGGVGRDVGIFQINDYYHPVVELNLEHDFKANIDYAWRMYKNDNYSFKRWTCGRAKGL